MSKAHNYWVSTTRPDGRPHVMPVWGVWIEEILFRDGPAVAQGTEPGATAGDRGCTWKAEIML